jgi:hypothetical protein
MELIGQTKIIENKKKCSNKAIYKLYQIEFYNNGSTHFIENNYEMCTLEQLLKKLKNDKGYHLRVCGDKNYIFFGDCDKFNGTFDKFRKLLIDFLDQLYKIKLSVEDISYTENESIRGSYHYSVPKIYGTCETLKNIHDAFYEKHKNIFCKKIGKKTKRVIDTSIYANKWFRYPNQSKESDSTVKHIIKHGNMVDFIVEYIPDYSVCIDNMKYVDNYSDNEDDIIYDCKYDDLVVKNRIPNLFKIRKIIDVESGQTDKIIGVDNKKDREVMIFENNIANTFKRKILGEILSGINTYDDFKDWTAVGMALKNESCDNNDFFDLWDNWSKQSVEKYDGTQVCKKKWRSFKKIHHGYSIHYLMSLLKKHDLKKFEQIQRYFDSQKFLKDNKCNFPNNKCLLNNIDSTDQSYNLILADDHCPIHDNEHHENECHRFFEINEKGTACMKCTNKKCFGKISPENGIVVPKNIIKKLFVINNNINIVNNYGNKAIYDTRVILGNNPKIFDDEQLNRLMIETLYEDDTQIAEAIVYTQKEKLCFITEINKWYLFNGFVWEECQNITSKIILKFVTLYSTIKKFIVNSTEIYGVEKRECLDQVNKIIRNIKSEKKNKCIITKLEEKLAKKNTFDMNMNLMAFTNGVYDFSTMSFRQSYPNDMIRTTCGYDYADVYVSKQNVLNLLAKIFPNKESIDFFLLYIASAMNNKNNSKLLLMLKWTNVRYRALLMRMLSSTFGEYYNCVADLSVIIVNKNKIPVDLSYLKSVRVLVIESVKCITANEICKLIDTRQIKHQNKNKTIEDFDKYFSMICMCEKEPIIGDDVLENTAMISMSGGKYEDNVFNKNDFFLLLTEYLKKINCGELVVNKKSIEIDERTETEKICHAFMKNCIKNDTGYVRCTDVYDRYVKWSDVMNYEKPLKKRQLFNELRKNNVEHKKTARFGNTLSSAFVGISLFA